MAEKEFTKQVTRLAKNADKLIQDVERDLGVIAVSLSDIKQSIEKLRDKFRQPNEKDES